MNVQNQITIDLARKGPTCQVHAMAEDAGSRSVCIQLRENGKAWTVPEGVSASVAYRREDGGSGWYDTLPDGTAACTVEGSTVTAALAPEMLAEAGTARAAVVFQDEALNQLATFEFYVHVEENPASGGTIGGDYYSLTSLAEINAAYEEILSRMEGLEAGGLTVSTEDDAIILGGEACSTED